MTEDENALIHSKSVEDFLKSVYVLQQQITNPSAEGSEDVPVEVDAAIEDEVTTESPRVSTNALAEVLAISPPSVTDMARRMANANLVDYLKYYGVRLTSEGETIALRVIRRHRLIELYLAEELNYDLHEVHDEAEKLEHAVSDRFIEAIAIKLGHPTVDPHGDPIPSEEGVIIRAEASPLTQLPVDVTARISRFVATNNDMLQHIMERGFKLGTDVTVLSRDPFDGPLTVQLDTMHSVIGHHVAACILVETTE